MFSYLEKIKEEYIQTKNLVKVFYVVNKERANDEQTIGYSLFFSLSVI